MKTEPEWSAEGSPAGSEARYARAVAWIAQAISQGTARYYVSGPGPMQIEFREDVLTHLVAGLMAPWVPVSGEEQP